MYAKIKAGNSNFIHVINIHTQANSSSSDKEKEMPRNIARIFQIIECRNFLNHLFFNYVGKEDLILFMGDFNINGRCEIYPVEKVVQFFEINPFGKEYFQDKNEYDLMMQILSNSKIYDIHNLFKENSKEFFPITFGDCFTCEKGINNPKEKILTHLNDQNTQQCLDFIFEVKKKTNFVFGKEESILIDETVSEKQSNKKFILSKAKVNMFEIEHNSITHFSDHYGVEVEVFFDNDK